MNYLCCLVLIAGVCIYQVTTQCSVTCGDSGCDDKTSDCNACKTVRYGPKCDQDCGTCVKDNCSSRACALGCKAGYFQVFSEPELSYCQPCVTNCAICTNSTYCIMCKDGFYPITSINSNGNGKTQCIPCSTLIAFCTSCYKPQNLVKCNRCSNGYALSGNECVNNSCQSYGCLNGCDNNGTCNGCVDGRLGPMCNYLCKYPCANCSIQDVCEKCHDGFYSQTCLQPCNSNCLSIITNSTCNFMDGKCSYGCNNGYWGHWCENKCSVNCKQFDGSLSICFQNGTCALGCKEGWEGDNCTQSTSMTTVPSSSVIGNHTTQSSTIITMTTLNVNSGTSAPAMTTNFTVSLDTQSSYITSTTSVTANTGTQNTEATTAMNGMTSTVAQNRDTSPNANVTDINNTKHGDITSVTTPLPVLGKTAMVVNSEDTFSVGAIAGGAGGGVFVIIIIVLVICFVKRRQRNGHDKQKKNNVGDYNILNPAFDPEFANSDQPVASQSTDYIDAKPIKPKDANSDLPAASPPTDYIFAQPIKQRSMIHKESIKDSKTKANMDMNEDEDIEIKDTVKLEELDEDEAIVKVYEIVTSTSADTYYNTEGILRSRIQVSQILDYIKEKSNFQSEFERLPKGLTRPCTEALKPHNLAKNRYNSIFAYDATRVVLKSNSYINASYIEVQQRTLWHSLLLSGKWFGRKTRG